MQTEKKINNLVCILYVYESFSDFLLQKTIFSKDPG